jgi:hypothetical protein
MLRLFLKGLLLFKGDLIRVLIPWGGRCQEESVVLSLFAIPTIIRAYGAGG